jgi:hypothetical protein
MRRIDIKQGGECGMDIPNTSPDEFCTEVGDGGTLAVPGHCGCMALSACASLATKIVVQCEALPLENATARGLAAGVGLEVAEVDGRWRLCGALYACHEACQARWDTASKAALCRELWERASKCEQVVVGARCLKAVVLVLRFDKQAPGAESAAVAQACAEVTAHMQAFLAMYQEYASRPDMSVLLDRLTAFM